VKRFRQPLVLTSLVALISVSAYGFDKPEDAIRAMEARCEQCCCSSGLRGRSPTHAGQNRPETRP
jgi:hypothetical protein